MTDKIDVQLSATRKPHPADGELGFGRVFSDHMFVMEWTPKDGWHRPRITPYQPLAIDPAAAVLHYGQALFDGFKAFRGQDGAIRVFRADAHCRRMAKGAERLCMPSIDPDFVEGALHELLRIDHAWVPRSHGTALYLRPTLVATEGFLGVRPAEHYTFFIIASPVGAYYAEGFAPVRIWVEKEQIRAARGGLGAVKAAANYAASLHAAHEAKRRGYAQVLWLDAAQHKYLEEVGTMNLFVQIGDEVATPALEGTILPGITRESVITLLRDWGIKVSERAIALDEVIAAHQRGTLKEVFGTGSAAVISAVAELGLGDQKVVVNDGTIGPVARRLFEQITGIQYATMPDTHRWMRVVEGLR